MKRRSLNEGNLSFFLSYSSLLLPRDSSREEKNLSTIILIYSLALHPDLVHGLSEGIFKRAEIVQRSSKYAGYK